MLPGSKARPVHPWLANRAPPAQEHFSVKRQLSSQHYPHFFPLLPFLPTQDFKQYGSSFAALPFSLPLT